MATVADNQQLIDNINALTADYRSQAETALQDLLSIADSKIWNNLGRVSANIAKAREVALGSLSDLPSDRPKVTLPPFVFNPQDFLSTDLLQQYTYDSQFFTYLDPKLREFIDDESYFISQTVQDALFAQTRERDTQSLNDALDASARIQARKGFPIPPDQLLYAQSDIIKRYMDTRADRNKEITALIADKAFEQQKLGVESGVRMEDIRSRFQLEYGRLYLQASDWLIRKYESDVRAEVARVNTEVEQLRLKTQIDMGMVNSDANWNQTLIGHLAQTVAQVIQDASNDLEVQKTQAKMQLDALKDIITYYSNAAASYAGQYNAVNLVSGTE
jgi:hypothetical protein